ncbi:FtsX-like permease family protein [Dactylosporangium sp. NPDC005555]|uniref:FtsX-like permease family protein n=1 Tax=Dactylosporangium sp. NPDC005555 TaxID=3154889 RepID=UPI0033A0D8E0
MKASLSRAAALIYEAAASARSQLVASLLTVAMVGGMCVAVLLTTGRTAATQQSVIATIDSMDTRSIIVRLDPSAGVTADVVTRLRAVHAIAAVAGLGPPVDAHNVQVSDGGKVPVRRLYGDLGSSAEAANSSPASLASPAFPSVAVASAQAARDLGLLDGSGGVITDDGEDVTVVSGLRVPPHLSFLEPLIVLPTHAAHGDNTADHSDVLSTLIVLAVSPSDVDAVTAVVNGFLTGIDPTKVSVQTSSQLAAVRAMVDGELNAYGHGTVLGILAISTALTMINLLALVTMRRRDFGRRRALGATRQLIVCLLLSQVGLLAIGGVVVGLSASILILLATSAVIPPVSFVAAVAITAFFVALLAALPPALLAARRDPLYELRVP